MAHIFGSHKMNLFDRLDSMAVMIPHEKEFAIPEDLKGHELLSEVSTPTLTSWIRYCQDDIITLSTYKYPAGKKLLWNNIIGPISESYEVSFTKTESFYHRKLLEGIVKLLNRDNSLIDFRMEYDSTFNKYSARIRTEVPDKKYQIDTKVLNYIRKVSDVELNIYPSADRFKIENSLAQYNEFRLVDICEFKLYDKPDTVNWTLNYSFFDIDSISEDLINKYSELLSVKIIHDEYAAFIQRTIAAEQIELEYSEYDAINRTISEQFDSYDTPLYNRSMIWYYFYLTHYIMKAIVYSKLHLYNVLTTEHIKRKIIEELK